MPAIFTLSWDPVDRESMRLCGWKEASAEPDTRESIRAVMHVIAHRALHWYGGDIGSVRKAVYAENQFSWTSPHDPNFRRLPADGDPFYASLEQLAVAILKREDTDPTKGALYYRNPAIATDDWFQRVIADDPAKHPEVAKIGHHIFYA